MNTPLAMTQQLYTYASPPFLSPFLPSVSLSSYPSFPSSSISHSLYLPLCLATPFNLSQNGSYLIEPNESGLCLVHKPFYLACSVSILLCASLATHYLKCPPSLLHLLTPQLPIFPPSLCNVPISGCPFYYLWCQSSWYLAASKYKIQGRIPGKWKSSWFTFYSQLLLQDKELPCSKKF